MSQAPEPSQQTKNGSGWYRGNHAKAYWRGYRAYFEPEVKHNPYEHSASRGYRNAWHFGWMMAVEDTQRRLPTKGLTKRDSPGYTRAQQRRRP